MSEEAISSFLTGMARERRFAEAIKGALGFSDDQFRVFAAVILKEALVNVL